MSCFVVFEDRVVCPARRPPALPEVVRIGRHLSPQDTLVAVLPIHLPDAAMDLAVSGTHVFIGGYESGLLVVDIADPGSPQLVGSLDTAGRTRGVALSGDIACVADTDYGLYVIDVADPENPQLLGSLVIPGHGMDVSVSGDLVCVAAHNGGLQIIDIADPANPVIIGSLNTPGHANGLTVSGDYAYIAAGLWTDALHVVDITNPTTPVLLGSTITPTEAWGVAVSGSYAYVATHGCGIQVVDIAKPDSPQYVGCVDTPYYAFDVVVSDAHVYVADSSSGLQVVQVECPFISDAQIPAPPPGVLHLRAHPNPSRAHATIQFETRGSGLVRAGIYDASGRLVRLLRSGLQSAGEHNLRWDGFGQAGQPAPPGIYYVRVVTARGSDSVPLTLIR